VVHFTLPPFVGGKRWLCLVDTNDPDRAEVSEFRAGDVYEVTGRSLLLFAGLTPGAPGRAVRRIALELSRGELGPA
jgi:glycogen operon protein